MEDKTLIDDALANKMQLWGFQNNVMIFNDFTLGAALDLSSVDASCFENGNINALKFSLVNLLNSLEPNIGVQFLQSITTGNDVIFNAHKALTKPNALPLYKKMTEERVDMLLAKDAVGEIPRVSLRMFIRAPISKNLKTKIRLPFFGGKNRKSPQESLQEVLDSEIAKFQQKLDQMRSMLEASGIGSKVIPQSEVYRFLYSIWNPDRPVEAIGLNDLSTDDVRDSLILTPAVVGMDAFSIGKFHFKVLSLKSIPENTFASMAQALRQLPMDSELAVSFKTTDPQKEHESLKMQQRLTHAMAAGAKGARDVESQTKLSEINELMENMMTGNERLFNVAINIVLKSESTSGLEDAVNQALKCVRAMPGAEAIVETYAAFPIFCDLAPPNCAPRERLRKMNSSVLADFLPIFGNWRGHDRPKVLLRNQEGGILGFDPFSATLPNSNQLISGGSGAGKSFLTSLIVNQMGKESPKVIMIDVGGSYERTCRLLGGQYIPLGMNQLVSLNPFDTNGASPEERDSKIKFLLSLVELMTKENESNSIGKLERAELEREISDVMRENEKPRLSNLKDRLLKHQDSSLSRLGKILQIWCGESPFGKLVDQETNIALTKNIVCFDLKGLEQTADLQAVALFIIMDFVWREVQRDRLVEKIVVFDEAWRLLESPSASEFIGSVFRTFRKYGASAIAISQAIDDFAKSRVAKAILPSSSIKWILNQAGGGVAGLTEELKLNQKEIQLISDLRSVKGEYSEAFLMCEGDRQVVRIEATPLEYWLATTHPPDLKTIEVFQARHPEMDDLEVLQMVAETYPKGAQGSINQLKEEV